MSVRNHWLSAKINKEIRGQEKNESCSIYCMPYPPTMAPILVLMGVTGEGAEVGVVSVTVGMMATAAVGYP